MKIAITAEGHHPEALISERFARCSGIYIYDTEYTRTTWMPNATGQEATQGAGVRLAATIIQQKVKVLVTGQCGPKAQEILENANVQIVYLQNMNRSEALKQILSMVAEGVLV